MEHDEINGASSDPRLALALTIRKIMEKELEPLVLKMFSRVIKPMVITTVQQEIVPLAEDLIRRVVKEIFQPVEEKLLGGGSRDKLPKGGSLHLKFLDDVSDTMTGDELKGIEYEGLKLALLDPDGHIVACGRESSAKVEILLLHDNGNDDMTIENFERSIIQTGEKKKPHFAKSVYISLKKGVGDLNGLKLGHDKDWIKLCNCRLGARIGQNLEGTAVQEAWTAPFKVTDKRDKQYGKLPRPSLSSEVWRLYGICRSGKRCDRLKDKNIKTLQDFLFWFHVNPEELQKQILCVGDGQWKTTVTHAETCIVDDKKMYSHKSSTEPQMRVIYDVVGELKGVIDESHFVPIHNLSHDRKDRARNLLSSVLEVSVFGERYNNVEASLLHQLPLQHCWNGNGLTLSENMSGYDSGPSSDSLGSKEMGSSPADPDYGEHNTPLHDSEVWRLNGIGRDGEPFRHLTEKNIKTVLDFLFWLSVNPKGLQEEMLGAGDDRWNTIVIHAQTCKIDDKKMYCHESSTEPQMRVVYDSAGKLKGVIDKSHFVPIDNLSADKKDCARKLLSSVLEAPAFGERYKSSFNDKDALLKEFPYISSDPHASTNSSISLQQGGLTVDEDMSGYQTIEPGSSSQRTIDPNNSYYSGPCDSLGSKEMGEPSNPASGQFSDPQITDYETSFLLNNVEEDFEPRSSLMSMSLPEIDMADVNPYNDMQNSSGVGESSSVPSNASFYSASAAMELRLDDEDYCPNPSSPNPMLYYVTDILSHNTGNETCGGGAVSRPKRWKKFSRLWFSLSWMSIDGSRSCKKRRVALG